MLVSVVVITFNSSKYILDTLESVKAQTYKNIELIISDDCSTDDTYEVCKKWLEDNACSFIRTTLTQTDQNGGISYNYNHGLKFAIGEWVKYIAGDDKLKQNCIQAFVESEEIRIFKLLICGTMPFHDNNGIIKPLKRRLLKSELFPNNARTQEKNIVKYGTYIEGPTLFIHRKTLLAMGGFDNKYPFIEDYPLYMKFLKNGYAVGLIEECLIE